MTTTLILASHFVESDPAVVLKSHFDKKKEIMNSGTKRRVPEIPYNLMLRQCGLVALFCARPIFTASSPHLVGRSAKFEDLLGPLGNHRIGFDPDEKLLKIIFNNSQTSCYAPSLYLFSSYENYKFIKQTPFIRSLHISGGLKMNEEIAQDVQQCTLLETFTDDCDSTDDEELAAVVNALASIPGQPLKKFSLTSVYGIYSASPFKQLGAKFPNLQHFVSRNQTEADAIISVCQCMYLRKLEFFSEHSAITRKHLQKIAKSLLYLEELILGWSTELEGADVEVLTPDCLQHLRVFKLIEENGTRSRTPRTKPVSQKDFDTICQTFSVAPKLESLTLRCFHPKLRDSATAVTDADRISFNKLMMLSSNLRSLSISFNDGVSFFNDEFNPVCFNQEKKEDEKSSSSPSFVLPNLEVLSLETSTWSMNFGKKDRGVLVTEKSFSTFSNRFPSLKELTINMKIDNNLSVNNWKSLSRIEHLDRLTLTIPNQLEGESDTMSKEDRSTLLGRFSKMDVCDLDFFIIDENDTNDYQTIKPHQRTGCAFYDELRRLRGIELKDDDIDEEEEEDYDDDDVENDDDDANPGAMNDDDATWM